jgi:flagellar basal-body rod protein FlgB
MRTALDNYLGIHPQALQLEAQRNDLLATNLANVDTPGYRARDIDFRAALAAAGAPSATAPSLALRAPDRTATPDAASTAAAGATDSAGGLDPTLLQYRVPMAPSLDGNTVDEQLEQAAFAENGVRYQASLTFLSTALRDLMTAITGS